MQRMADRWVEALLSGEYVQGTGRLRQVEGDVTKHYVHCVMGVLAQLDHQLQRAMESAIPPDARECGATWGDAGRLMPACEDRLNQLGLGWLLLPYDGSQAHHAVQDLLISKNDHNTSFEDLAEVIRALDERYTEAA